MLYMRFCFFSIHTSISIHFNFELLFNRINSLKVKELASYE